MPRHIQSSSRYLSQLTGKDAETLEQELSGQIYRLPDGNLEAPTFVLAEEYLSGNVREKLREARAAAEQQPIYQPNVTALEQVQPEDLSPAEISVRLGSTWVPESDIQQFVLTYIGELTFNMLVLVGLMKGANQVTREMLGL